MSVADKRKLSFGVGASQFLATPLPALSPLRREERAGKRKKSPVAGEFGSTFVLLPLLHRMEERGGERRF
jgi:hypothetical protein